MTAADLARLEMAKRAYVAAQPSATEVQTGVRRARLSLRRMKSRRNWFGKGLVLVVLAVGSLAYAKPHALGELVENLTYTGGVGAAKRGGKGVGVPAPVLAPVTASLTKSAATMVAPTPSLDAPLHTSAPVVPESHKERPRAVRATTPVRSSNAASQGAAPVAKGAASASQEPPAPVAVSDWGRVAQALARGDETKALAALSELSESDDQRTRDKADLGRAQLFMAHGDSSKGCALARSLSNRRAGSHIERQAQLLLKSCTR